MRRGGADVLVPQSEVHRQLRSDVPVILQVPGESGVPFGGELTEYRAIEFGGQAEQKAAHAEACSRDPAIPRDVLSEIEVSPRALVHREKVKALSACIDAPTQLMASSHVRPIADELKNGVELEAGNSGAGRKPHGPPAGRSAHGDAGQALGQRVVSIDPLDADLVVSLVSFVELVALQGEANDSEPCFCEQGRAEGVSVVQA